MYGVLCTYYHYGQFYYCRVQPSASESGLSQSSSLPRSGGSGNISSSSSSTLPSHGSPVSSPGIVFKQQSPSRYQQKQQQVNGFVKKTSPLTKTQPEPIKRAERLSSPEILMTDTVVPIEQQNRGGEEQLSTDVIQEQANEQQYDDVRPQLAELVKKTDDETQLTNTHDVNTAVNSTPTIKPVVTRRPKILPKKPLPPPTCRTDNAAPKPAARKISSDAQTIVQNRPIPRPRSRGDTPLSDEGRRSCSPSVFDDESEVPPAKPPRRRSAQISSTRSFSDDTLSPVATTRHTFHVLPTCPVEKSNEMISPPPLPLRQSKPALPPKPRKTSSTSTIGLDPAQALVVERLNIDEIDLANFPYSTTVSD